MDLARDELHGPWVTTGSIGWTMPTGVICVVGGIALCAAFGLYMWFAQMVPCEHEGRIELLCAVVLGTGGACLPAAAVRPGAMRLISICAGGAVGSAIAWAAIHAAFAHHFC